MRIALILLLATIGLAAQPAAPALSETLTLRARIVLLEAEISTLRIRAAMAAIEKEAGCALDWSKDPVVCRLSSEK